MLVIRDQQMQVFKDNAKKQFEAETIRHISRFAPKQYEILGEKTIGQIVRKGVERAEKHGFTNRGPVRFFVELMFMLGSDFDTDPQYPWVAEILGGSNQFELQRPEATDSGSEPATDESDQVPHEQPQAGALKSKPALVNSPPDQMTRAGQLYQKAMRYIEMAAGTELEYEREALYRIVGPTPVAFKFPGDDTSGISAFFRKVYPQKCDYIGDSALEELVRRGISSAAAFSRSAKAAVIFAGLMLIFGHGCLSDPQFPWIANTLEKDAPGDVNTRIEHLWSKTRIYLENALKELEGRAQNAPEWM